MAKNKNRANQNNSQTNDVEMNNIENQGTETTGTETSNDVNMSIEDIAITETKVNDKGQTEVHTSEGILLMDADGNVIGMKRGRPSDPTSDRAQRLKAQADRKALAEAGEIALNKSGDLRGRPANPNSDRQKRLANATPGAKQGRPVKADSERQKKIAERAEKLKNLTALIAAKGIKPGVALTDSEMNDSGSEE